MRLGDDRTAAISRTAPDSSAASAGGGGGNLLGCLLPLVASRFGIVGVLILCSAIAR